MSVSKDLVAVGSLESEARGQGARKNAGKPQWFQIPWWTVSDFLDELPRVVHPPGILMLQLQADMAAWQRGDDEYLDKAIKTAWELVAADIPGRDFAQPLTTRDLLPVVRVLEFGAKKYAIGNWTKGMPWSVCFSCVISHLTKRATGELLDDESEETHASHILCNLLFLKAYQDIYPEGDDRLPGFRHGGIKKTPTET